MGGSSPTIEGKNLSEVTEKVLQETEKVLKLYGYAPMASNLGRMESVMKEIPEISKQSGLANDHLVRITEDLNGITISWTPFIIDVEEMRVESLSETKVTASKIEEGIKEVIRITEQILQSNGCGMGLWIDSGVMVEKENGLWKAQWHIHS